MWNAFVNLFYIGGWVLFPIFGVSIVAWYIGINRYVDYLVVGHSRIKFIDAVKGNKSCQETGYDLYNKLLINFTEKKILKRQNLYGAFLIQLQPRLYKGLSTMTAIVVIAPLLGLLGTITGMNEMFSVIGRFGFGSPSLMAHGISVALQATLTGLGVAVAILFFHNFLVNKRNMLLAGVREDYRLLFGHSAIEDSVEEKAKGNVMHPDYRLIPEDTAQPEINLAPFVDTIMILLIFFVVTANMYVETGVDVSKPKASTAKTIGNKALLIGVTREGSIHVFGRQVSIERLRMLVEQEVLKQPDLTIVIISDKNAVIGRAIEVMDQCALAGAQKVSIAAGKD